MQQRRVCVIDLSASDIRAGVFVDDTFKIVDLELPWEVGFRQAMDGSLAACFGTALGELDPKPPIEVRFTDLDVYFGEIVDSQTVACVLRAFFEKILPALGYGETAMSVYVITPYRWSLLHRQQLRRVLKDDDFPNLTLRGVLSQVLCLAGYYRKVWAEKAGEDGLRDGGPRHLFHVEFTQRDDIVLYQLLYRSETEVDMVELRDILRYPEVASDPKDRIEAVCRAVRAVGNKNAVMVGFLGDLSELSKAVIIAVKAEGGALLFAPDRNAILLGGAELIGQLESNSPASRLQFHYGFCFGVKLPGGQWVELLPSGWSPPCERKRAFRVTGIPEPFSVPLCCGVSLSEVSDLHRLATVSIDVAGDENTVEFVLSLAMADMTKGTFTVHLPEAYNRKQPDPIEFTVPVLMD